MFKVPVKTVFMCLICNRIYDCLPLYDIQNQFHKAMFGSRKMLRKI